MKEIKFILLLLLPLLLSGCMTDEEKLEMRKAIYYLDENFILTDKELIKDTDGTVRVWKLHRVNNPLDTVYVGEIRSFVREPESDDCGCNGNYYITNELWYNKEIGDVLHFDYIRKNRFFPLHSSKVEGYVSVVDTENTIKVDVVPESPEIGYGTETYGSSDLDYADRLRLERKLDELKEEIKEIEEQLK